jgi:hypothetical protein
MKACAYCGKENQDSAVSCAECGTDSFNSTADTPAASPTTESAPSELRLRDILADPAKLFRALVVISTVNYLIWFFQLVLGGRLISPGTWDALSWNGYGALLPFPEKIWWLMMLLSVAVAVGLFHFSKSARLVFTCLIGFFGVARLLAGVQVETALDSLLGYITNIADGAVIVMAYTSPLRERFVSGVSANNRYS